MFGGSFPFEEFGGMGGGFPGQRGPKKNVDTEAYYKLLGVDKKCSFNELKKAYHKKALKMHPDKGGDPDLFKEITHAYEVLSDKDKRDIYDTHGEDGIKEGAGPSGGDIFSQMFGGGGGMR